MLERYERILKTLCAVLGAVVLYEVSHLAMHINPLRHVAIPALPALATEATAPKSARRTNSEPKASSNLQPHASGTNATASSNELGPIAPGKPGTNALVLTEAKTTPPMPMTEMTMPGMPVMGGHPRPGGGMPGAADLPAEIKARVDCIAESEILGPMDHPLPMALLGIAGDQAFLRTDSGETGLVKIDAKLGDLKLLQIGINRVLVEKNGEKKELTIFSGLGGNSLLSN
jgi:hypothetical protein